MVLCFALRQTPRIFRKLLKLLALALLRQINMRIIHISKQYASNEPKVFRTYTDTEDIDFSITKFGFCNKFEERSNGTCERLENFITFRTYTLFTWCASLFHLESQLPHNVSFIIIIIIKLMSIKLVSILSSTENMRSHFTFGGDIWL